MGMLGVLALLGTMVATNLACHNTEIEYKWSIGPPPGIPFAKNTTVLDGYGDVGDAWKGCMEKGRIYSNVVNQTIWGNQAGITGPQDCMAACFREPYCNYWNLLPRGSAGNPSNVFDCYLMGEESAKVTNKTESWSGLKTCDERELEACTEERCGARGDWSQCSPAGEQLRNYLNATVSGCDQCEPETQPCQYRNTGCFETGLLYPGARMVKPGTDSNLWATYGEMPTPEECQELCSRNPPCRWFNHTTTGCWLKTSKGAEVQRRSGAVSGPVRCPPPVFPRPSPSAG